MASKVWSQEERAKACLEISLACNLSPSAKNLMSADGDSIENVAVYKQMELTEAVGIINEYCGRSMVNELASRVGSVGLPRRAKEFLARNATPESEKP